MKFSILGLFLVVYIDDLLIYSTDPVTHVQQVRQVLHRPRENNLFVKAEKCEFHKTTISFLGYVLGPEGVMMDDKKSQRR